MKKTFTLLALILSLSTIANTDSPMNCSSFSEKLAKNIFIVEAAGKVVPEQITTENFDSFMLPVSSPDELMTITQKRNDGLLYFATVSVDSEPKRAYLVEVISGTDQCLLKNVKSM